MKKKHLALVLGIAVMSTSVMTPCIAAEPDTETVQAENTQEPEVQPDIQDQAEPAAAEEAVPEEAPAAPETEAFEGDSPDIVEESADELEADDALASSAAADKSETNSDGSDKRVEQAGNVVDADGLIEDDGTVTSDSIPGEPSVSLEELWDDQMHNRMFPGFEVDPSKYPPANITVNTITVYRFLTKEMKLNHAAACGVLANIQLESNFRPLALGDSGTSYGICQWHNGRFSSLMSFCKSRGLDYNTLKGQLAYLEWDLTHGYKGVYTLLLKMQDTEEGAYEAGYLFCYHFEIPDQVAARSIRRGNLARDEYFNKDFDQLEWELRHSTLLFGEDQLETLDALDKLDEEEQQPVAALSTEEGWEDEAEEVAGVEETEAGLPEWQSALGELSLLL